MYSSCCWEQALFCRCSRCSPPTWLLLEEILCVAAIFVALGRRLGKQQLPLFVVLPLCFLVPGTSSGSKLYCCVSTLFGASGHRREKASLIVICCGSRFFVASGHGLRKQILSQFASTLCVVSGHRLRTQILSLFAALSTPLSLLGSGFGSRLY